MLGSVTSYIQPVAQAAYTLATDKNFMFTALAVGIISSIPTAAAGPLAYSACIAASGPAGPILCIPFLLAPGP